MSANAARADFTRLLNPRAIAVVGATPDASRIGGQPISILIESGYQGRIYGVNPKYQKLNEIACYPDIAAVPKPCDLALIAVAAKLVPDVIRQCGSAGIPFTTVFSAGFREVGAEGDALEAELKEAVAASGVRMIGPNCLGTMNLVDRVYCGFGVSFRNSNLRRGPVAFVSQSGGFAYSVVALAEHEGMGFNYIVSAGNETDITTLEMVADFLERDEVEVVVMYIEGVNDGMKLREIGARALELGKPILIWKVGNSAVGRAAAESHTASMTAPYELYRAAFREGGFIELSDVHDLVDLTRAFLGKRLPRGPNIAIVTTSGGAAVLMADACDRYGLKLRSLAPQTVTAIGAHAPKYSSLANPIDVTAQISGRNESFNAIVELVLNDPNVDQLIVRYGKVEGAAGEAWAHGLVEIVARSGKPLLVSLGRVPSAASGALRALEANRLPWVLTPLRTAVAAGALHQYAEKRRRFFELKSRAQVRPRPRIELGLPAAGARLSESESKQLLVAYGVTSTREILLSSTALDALKEAPLAFPLVVKVDSPDIPHKTEAGGVRVGIKDLAGLKHAGTEVMTNARRHKPAAHINGVLVAEMAAGTEVIVGVVNDPYFGPVVMFGLGGVFAELLKDVTYRFAPFDPVTALEMISEIKSAPCLTGYRDKPALAVEALADLLSRISWLAHDRADRIAEIDINPLFVNVDKVVAVDALIVLKNK